MRLAVNLQEDFHRFYRGARAGWRQFVTTGAGPGARSPADAYAVS